jgi:hypothetical protein
MSIPAKLRPLILLLVLVPGFAAVWRLQRGIDSRLVALNQEQEKLVLRSGPMLRFMSLEYAPLVADLYWTRAVQYYGARAGQHDLTERLELLWPLLDITTTLDPNLIPAYRFGATFLAEPPPRGAGKPELAVELLYRGIKSNPEYWRLYEDLGFVYYFDLHDFEKASNAFLEGSKVPGAMVWMKVLAARVAERGETRETSAFLWNEIYSSATDPSMKQNALTHLQLLTAETDCEKLDELATMYEKRTGQLPTSMQDLVRAGLVPGRPVDPLGFEYIFDSDGMARLNPASPLHKDKPIYQLKF